MQPIRLDTFMTGSCRSVKYMKCSEASHPSASKQKCEIKAVNTDYIQIKEAVN